MVDNTVPKQIRNAAQASFVLGVFMTIILVLGVIVGLTSTILVGVLIAGLVEIALFVWMIVLARKLKTTKSVAEGKKRILTLIFITAAVLLLAIWGSIISGGNGIITVVLTAVLLLTLIVNRQQLK